MKIKGLIFDMDGTMFDTEVISVSAMEHAAELYGIQLPRETMLGFMGLPGAEIRRQYLELFGDAFDYAGYRRKKIDYQDAVIDRDGVPVKPGLCALLEYARRRGLRCAVATSTNRDRAEDLIRRAGVWAYFDAVICGEDVEQGKPAPDIFCLAAKTLGLAPEACAGIEDSRNGILAARRAGMFAILVPDLIPADEDMLKAADLRADSLDDVLDYLREMECGDGQD